MNGVEVTEFGDGEILQSAERDTPEPGSGEVRIGVEAMGVNFADIIQRRGHYTGGPQPPYVPGLEAAGTIETVGEGVDRNVGERVVAMTSQAYAEYTTADADALFDVPEGMSFEAAAGFPVQFLTAHNTLFEWGGLEGGERVLIQRGGRRRRDRRGPAHRPGWCRGFRDGEYGRKTRSRRRPRRQSSDRLHRGGLRGASE